MRPGSHDVERGLLATVVTTLAHDGSAVRPDARDDVSLVDWHQPDPASYRALFRRVGATWLWFSRLGMDDERLNSILSDPLVRVFRLMAGDEVVGFVELDNRQPGLCELQFVGLAEGWTGRGVGGWLLAHAVRHAWGSRVERVLVRTCTLDHPAALPAYRRAGFVAVERQVQLFPDPRLIGLLPRSAAPQTPLIEP